MAAFRLLSDGAASGRGRGGVAAPRRSTTATTEPATMAVTRVPATSISAADRRQRGRSGAGAEARGIGAGRTAGAGSPTQTPKGGGRSGTPPAGDHNRDMTLPPPGQAAQVAGIVARGSGTEYRETYIVRPGHRTGPPARAVDGPERPAPQATAGPRGPPAGARDHRPGQAGARPGQVT